jgi:ubiquinone/menaquinone biosynthesis C-methylase UbiE
VSRPHFIAEQARHAHGLLGRLIAFIMARETWPQNLRAIDALGVAPSDHVLDVGCGPGRSLAVLAQRAPKGHVVGVDPSDLMAEIAVNRNSALVKARRVEVMIGSACDLPFEDSAFDKALCVHVVYFWKDLNLAFREIARVLKPGACRTDADHAAVRAFPAEVYRFRPLAELKATLESAGFVLDPVYPPGAGAAAPLLLAAEKRREDVG